MSEQFNFEGFERLVRAKIAQEIEAQHDLERCADSRCTQATENEIVFNCSHLEDAAIVRGRA
jgi:hypothetical protein